MNAIDLHPPARSARVARHYLALLGRHRTVVVVTLTFFLGMLSTLNSSGFLGFEGVVPLMALLPLVQWTTSVRRGEIDHAMPLDRVRHELLQVAAGAAWALLAMLLPLALVTLLALQWNLFRTGHPATGIAWIPPVLLLAGLACYLLGAAAWLRGARSGLLLCAFYGLSLVPVALLGPRWGHVERILSLDAPITPAEGVAGMVAAALAAAAAGAVVWLVAAGPRWRPRVGSRAVPARRPAPARPAGAPPAADARRRPARPHAVLWSELRLLRGPTLVGVAVAVACTLWLVPGILRTQPPALHVRGFLTVVRTVAVWWPVVVWLRGRGPWRRRLEPLPVGALALRLSRVAAGAVSLEAVVLAAILAHLAGGGPRLAAPASYPGVACGALLLYLVCSFPLVLARDHVVGWSVAWVCGMLTFGIPVWTLFAPPGVLSPGAALSVFSLHPVAWLPAILLWTTVVAALLVAATHGGVLGDRDGPHPFAAR